MSQTFAITTSMHHNKPVNINITEFGGSGLPLMLLHHANGFCGGTWKLVAEQLTGRFHVFAIDARGHGNSDQGNILEDLNWDGFVDDFVFVATTLCEKFGQEQIAYGVGSSFGGIVTAAAEARRPGTFARIAMLDPPIHPTVELVARFGLDIPAFNPVKDTLVAQTLRRRTEWPSTSGPRDSWRRKGMFATWPDAAFELYLTTCLAHHDDGSVSLKCDPKIEAHVFETTGNLNVADYAPKVLSPVLYVRAKTGHVPAAFCEGVAGLFPHSRYEEIAGGHLLPLEVPGLVVERLLAFAEK